MASSRGAPRWSRSNVNLFVRVTVNGCEVLELNQLVSGYEPEKIPTSHPHLKFIRLENGVKWLRYAELKKLSTKTHLKNGFGVMPVPPT